MSYSHVVEKQVFGTHRLGVKTGIDICFVIRAVKTLEDFIVSKLSFFLKQ